MRHVPITTIGVPTAMHRLDLPTLFNTHQKVPPQYSKVLIVPIVVGSDICTNKQLTITKYLHNIYTYILIDTIIYLQYQRTCTIFIYIYTHAHIYTPHTYMTYIHIQIYQTTLIRGQKEKGRVKSLHA